MITFSPFGLETVQLKPVKSFDFLTDILLHPPRCHFSVTNARLAKQQARFVRDVCGNTNENGQAGATRVIEVDYLRHPDESNGLTSERASSCVGENSWIGMNGWTNGGIDEGRRIGENSWMNNQRNYSRISEFMLLTLKTVESISSSTTIHHLPITY